MNEGVPVTILFIVLGIIVFFVLVQAVMNGIAMQQLMKSKGYDGNWFWQGFIFGPFAFLGASQREDRRKAAYPDYILEAIQKATEEHNLANGGWKCESCGAVNPANTGTCVCGKNRFEEGEK